MNARNLTRTKQGGRNRKEALCYVYALCFLLYLPCTNVTTHASCRFSNVITRQHTDGRVQAAAARVRARV